ncbi:MAG: PD-(D/E)XK nuclease family protein [Spirochaetales bacterium]|nr:PD-(D/E)XK nuclease family protein [Spirochaetales bacterium]
MKDNNTDYEYILAKSFKNQVLNILPELNREHGIGLVSIFGNTTSELSHSNVLYVLLNPKSFSNSEYICNSFLNLVGDKCGMEMLKHEHILSIEREKVTNTGRRIDLYITTEKCNIILENKVFAGDQEQQLSDYIDYIDESFPNKINVILYLTPFGHEPSSWSISKTKLNLLKTQNRFVAISYEKDIYGWLDGLVLDGILKHEIAVYKKMLKENICHMNNTWERFFRKYYMEMKSMVLDNPNEFIECIHGLDYIATTVKNLEMIEDLHLLLKEEEYDAHYICEQSYLYSQFSEFEKRVLDNCLNPYGICVNVNESIRIGLEYNPKNEFDGVWYFGFMKGIDGTPAEIKNKDGIDEKKLTPNWADEGYKIFAPCEWWGECALVDYLVREYINNSPQDAANNIIVWIENQIKFTSKS